jgi:hypothetical protein
MDGPFTYKLQNIQYNKDNITAEYKSFGVVTDECVIKLEISDGLSVTTVYSDLITYTKDTTTNPPAGDKPGTDTPPSSSMSCNFGTYVGMALVPAMLALFILKKRQR